MTSDPGTILFGRGILAATPFGVQSSHLPSRVNVRRTWSLALDEECHRRTDVVIVHGR
jgi:hypothetical protein